MDHIEHAVNRRLHARHKQGAMYLPLTLAERSMVGWLDAVCKAMHLALGALVRSDTSSVMRTAEPSSFSLGLWVPEVSGADEGEACAQKAAG